jgi:hypothetical protein
MYKVLKIEKVFTSKFVVTGPSSYKKNILQTYGVTKVENHCSRALGNVLLYHRSAVQKNVFECKTWNSIR